MTYQVADGVLAVNGLVVDPELEIARGVYLAVIHCQKTLLDPDVEETLWQSLTLSL